MIQLKNLRDELTGLVESRFGSLQDQIDSLPDGSGTTPTPGNFVTLDGIQTIAGVKTFSALCEFINGLNVKAYSDAGGGQLRLMFPLVNDASPLPAGQVVCITFILNPSRNPLVNGNVWEVGTNYSNGNFFIRTGPSLNCLVINSSGVCNAVFGLETPSIRLNGAELSTTLGGKQASLTADATGTKILNQTTIRSLTAERGVSLEVVGEAIKIIGPDLSGYALSSAKQDKLTAKTSDTPIMRDTTIRALAAGTNMSFSTANDVITINGPNLGSYATSSDLNAKQASLTADATGTKILNGTTVRSVSGQQNVSLEVVGDKINIKGPDLSSYALSDAKQDKLTAKTTDTPIMRDTTIRALAAGTNMSFSTANDVITINGPGLTNYALKDGPTFTGTVTTPLLNVQDYLLTQASEVIMYKPLRCTQGLRAQAWELLGSQHTLSAENLGGLVLCKANNQTIVVMRATDYAGGYFEIIVPGPTTLTLPAGGGTFTGPAGSGAEQLMLQAAPSPHYRLVSDGIAWRVTNMVGIQGIPGQNGINGIDGTNGTNVTHGADGVLSTAQLTQLYQNFTLSGGGTLTIKNIGGIVR
jgi:hypothetical protein